MPPISPGYRLSIVARAVAAVVGAYMLTSLAITLLALLFPFEPSEAALVATMLSFAIYAGIAVTVFAMRSVWRMGAYMIAALVILRAALWVCQRTVGS